MRATRTVLLCSVVFTEMRKKEIVQGGDAHCSAELTDMKGFESGLGPVLEAQPTCVFNDGGPCDGLGSKEHLVDHWLTVERY